MAILALVRHGESLWNKENRFTGWIDIDLSGKGVDEAHSAAKKLEKIKFGAAYTSALCRAQHTLGIMLEDMGQAGIRVMSDEALNERMYGDLQGKNKDEMRKEFGAGQVQVWRRSFDVRPPNGESLKDTCERVLPYFRSRIEKDLLEGRNVLVVAHGNSLRAIVKHIEGISDSGIPLVEIPTGQPWVYEMGKEGGRLAILKKEILH